MQLLELVYEGGEVLDLCLDFQRKVLRGELGDRFGSVDMRCKTSLERKNILQQMLIKRGATFGNVLVRGLSGLQEASHFFTRSSLLIDALGQSEPPSRRELAPLAFRTKRVFVYSKEMEVTIREAGIGAITRRAGPYLPTLDLDTDGVSNCIGVLDLGRGALEVVGQLKRRREQEGLEFEIVTTLSVPETVEASSVLDVASRCGLLVAPYEQIDNGGPNEAGLLALSTGRVLCTCHTSALHALPLSGRLLLAKRYEKNSYVDTALGYEGLASYEEAIRSTAVDAFIIPTEILKRVT